MKAFGHVNIVPVFILIIAFVVSRTHCKPTQTYILCQLLSLLRDQNDLSVQGLDLHLIPELRACVFCAAVKKFLLIKWF